MDSETNTLLLIMEEKIFLAKNHLLSKCMLLLTLLLVMYAILIQSAKTPPLSYNLQQALIQIFPHPINNRWIELSPALHT